MGGFVRRLSPNYRRNKARKSTSATYTPAPPAVSQSSSAPLPPVTNGYQIFKSSDHPSRPRTTGTRDGRGDVGGFATACSQAYNALSDCEEFELEARRRNEARRVAKASAPREPIEQTPAPEDRPRYGCVAQLFSRVEFTLRIRKLALCLSRFKDSYKALADEVGWVGWFPVGGVDEHGQIKSLQCVPYLHSLFSSAQRPQ